MRGIVKIIILEDSKVMSTIEEKILKSKGYNVEIYHSPEHVMDAIERVQPQLFISDINLQEGTAIDVIREVARSGMTKVLVSTAVQTPYTIDSLKRVGVEGIIIKPFKSEDFLQKVDEIIGINI